MVGVLRRGPGPWGRGFISCPSCCAALAIMAVFRPGLFQGGPASMSLRALLYRRPSEPSAVQVVFDKAIYLVRLRRHRQARRYTLRIDAAVARGGSHHAAARQREGSQGIRAEARRLDRGAAQAAAGSGAVRARDRGAAARRAAPHRASPRRARHGVDRDRRRAASRLLCVAGEAPHVDRRVGDFLKREAQRDLDAASRRYAAKLGVPIKRICGARPVEPLGLVLEHRRAVVLLAAYPRAAVRARLSRRARGRPPRRAQPFAAVLAAGEAALSRRRARQGLARRATAPTCIATACPSGAAPTTSEPASAATACALARRDC